MSAEVTHRFMTVPEVAEFLRVRPGTVRDWYRQGKLPGFKAGAGRTSPVLFEAAQVEAAVRSWKAKSQ